MMHPADLSAARWLLARRLPQQSKFGLDGAQITLLTAMLQRSRWRQLSDAESVEREGRHAGVERGESEHMPPGIMTQLVRQLLKYTDSGEAIWRNSFSDSIT